MSELNCVRLFVGHGLSPMGIEYESECSLVVNFDGDIVSVDNGAGVSCYKAEDVSHIEFFTKDGLDHVGN